MCFLSILEFISSMHTISIFLCIYQQFELRMLLAAGEAEVLLLDL